MAQIISEGLEHIGGINDDGYIFDASGNCFAKINDSGYIGKVGGGAIYGKIDNDGAIRNASGEVVGRIQADGYVYIHSRRVCRVSSSFIEKITPNAWNAGEPSSYSGRSNSSSSNYEEREVTDSFGYKFFTSSFFLKIVIGIALGIFAMVQGWGGIEMLLAAPCGVLLISFVAKICNNLF